MGVCLLNDPEWTNTPTDRQQGFETSQRLFVADPTGRNGEDTIT